MVAQATATPRLSRSKAPVWLWALALVVVVPVAAPLVSIVWQVATDPSWELLVSGRLAQLMGNTLGLVVAVTASATALGVGGAWVVTRFDLPMARLWSAILALPLVLPSYVLALALLAATGPRGSLQSWIGVSVPAISGFWGSWIALTLTTYPYVFLLATVTLRRMDPALEEAARGLGASAGKVFRTVVLGQLRPAVGASALLVALYTLSDFGAVSLMRFDTFTRAIYTQWSVRLDRTPALTLAVVLVVVAAGLVWLEQANRGRASYFATKPTRGARVYAPRGAARWGVYLALGALVLAALVIPISVLVFWLVRGIGAGQTLTGLALPALRSAGVALGAAGVGAAAAVPIAVLAVRYPSRGTRWLERSVWSVYALPHITVAVAILAMVLSWARPLYQTLAVLIGAYVVLFLPQASGAVNSALLQVNPHVEEAGRSLGATHAAALARLTLPLIGRGLLSGGALIFLTVMKELPATLLLRPTGFETLAVAIWQQSSEGLFTRASSAALVLLAISSIPMFLISTRDLRDD